MGTKKIFAICNLPWFIKIIRCKKWGSNVPELFIGGVGAQDFVPWIYNEQQKHY